MKSSPREKDLTWPTVLVAGGTGALGSAVVDELLDAGYAVTSTWIVERERERVRSAKGSRSSRPT